MFCFKCGNELPNDASFCSKCGTLQKQEDYTDKQSQPLPTSSKSIITYWVALLTSPLLFIIRMANQTSVHVSAGTNGAWRSYDKMVVPGNYKAIMFVILAASTAYVIANLFNNTYSSLGKKIEIAFIAILNILLGIAIIMVEG